MSGELESKPRAALAGAGEEEWLGLGRGDATPSGTSLSSAQARSSSGSENPTPILRLPGELQVEVMPRPGARSPASAALVPAAGVRDSEYGD